MSDDRFMTEQRLLDMEVRLAHQDKTIADLNDVIASQWKKLDGLERQLRQLDAELQALDVDTGPAQQKPPHY
jgi:SlyX protein